MVLGIPSDRDALFYSLDQNSNTAIISGNNSTRALDLWRTVNDSLWFKTDNFGDVLPSEVSLNFDLNKGGNARGTGPNYVFNLYMRATKGNSIVVDKVSGKPFFVRTVKDISPTSSIIRIRPKSFGFRRFCVRQRRRLSNKFLE